MRAASPTDSFIDLAYAQSMLDCWAMYLTGGFWGTSDREVLCVAWTPPAQS